MKPKSERTAAFHTIAQIANRFDYPKEIEAHLHQLFGTVLDTIPSNCIYSVLLLGSTPRGELTYIKTEGDLDVLSDYEFVIVTERKIPRPTLRLLDDKLLALTKSWAIKSPFFHIDYAVSSKRKFKLTPPTFWAFEAVHASAVIYGNDARRLLPNVTIKNLDLGNLNELVLVRLWNMMLFLNDGVLDGDANPYEKNTVKMAYARNSLDVISIYLPNQGVLTPGYEARMQSYTAVEKRSIWRDLTPLFKKATRHKLSPADHEISLSEAQQLFLLGFGALLFEFGKKEFEKNTIASKKYFDLNLKSALKEKFTRTVRRKYMDLKVFRRYYKYDLRRVNVLYKDVFRKKLILTMMHMHLSVDANQSKHERDHNLGLAFAFFNEIGEPSNLQWSEFETYGENFRRLRLALLEFMFVWFYGRTRESKKRLERLVGWREYEDTTNFH